MSLWSSLGSIAKGVYNQLRIGDNKTFKTSWQDDEERRRRQQQLAAQRAAAQAQANVRVQQQSGNISIAQPQKQPRISIRQPNQPQTLKIAAPSAYKPIKVQDNGPRIDTPQPQKDTRSFWQKLKDQVSVGDDKTWKQPIKVSDKRTITERIGDQFEANSPQDIAARKAAGQPERYEDQLKQSWVRRNLTPKGVALNVAHLGQDIATQVPTAAVSLLEAGRRNAVSAKSGTLKQLEAMSYEERKRMIDQARSDPKNGLPIVLQNMGLNLDDPSDQAIAAAYEKLKAGSKPETYTPGSRIEKAIFGTKEKPVESYQQRSEGITEEGKPLSGLPAPLVALGLAGLDWTPGGGAKSKLAKEIAGKKTVEEVLSILTREGLNVAPDVAENLAKTKSAKKIERLVDKAISDDLDNALKNAGTDIADEGASQLDNVRKRSNIPVEDGNAVKVAGETPERNVAQLVEDRTPIVPTRPLNEATKSKVALLKRADLSVPRPEGTVRLYQADIPGNGRTNWVFNNIDDLKNFMGPETTDAHVFNIVDTPADNVVPTSNGKTVFQLGDPDLAQFTDAAQATKKKVADLGDVGQEVSDIRKTSGARNLEDLAPEQRQFVEEYAGMLQDMESGLTGGQLVPDGEAYGYGYKRTSEHTPFYRDYYAQNGRAPSKQAYIDEALRQLNSGQGDSYAVSAWRTLDEVHNNPELRDLMQNYDRYQPDAPLNIAQPENINIQDLPLNVRVEAQSGLPIKVPVTKEGQAQLPITGELRDKGFAQSAKNSPELSEGTRKAVSGGKYEVRSQESLLANTEELLQDPERASQTVFEALRKPAGKISDQDVSDAIGLSKYYDEMGSDFGFEQSSNILDQLDSHLRESGRTVAAAQLLERRSPQGLLYMAQRDLKRAGVWEQLDETAKDELAAHIERIKATEPDTLARQFEVHQLNQFVNSKIPSSIGDKTFGIWRSGLLTAPTTTIGNIIGNTTRAAMETSSSPLVAFFDRIMSLKTGERTRTATLRGRLSGAKEGAGKMGTFLKTGFDERNVTNKFEYGRELTFGDGPAGKFAKAYTTSVRRWIGGQDMPFYYSALNNSLEMVAQAEAKNQGLRGKAARSFIETFKKEPPEELLQRANDTALKQVFQEKTALGWLASQIQRVPGGKIVVPFAQVPASIATQILDWTPVGAAKEIFTQVRNKKFDQYALSKALGDSTMGTVGMMALGYTLQANGLMTLGYPSDAKERALWQQEGKQPFSINIGGHWVSTNYMQPFGTIMAMGGSVHDAMQNGENPASAAFGTAGQSITNQSFLRGLSGVIDAFQEPSRYAGRFVENLAGSVVPNVVKRLAAATDTLQRQANGVGDAIKQGIPGLRETVQPRTDVFGQEQPNTAGFWGTMFDATRATPEQHTALTDELRRLQDAGQGVMPSVLDSKQTFNGESVTLSDEQVFNLQKAIGSQVKDAWSAIMKDPTYQSLTDDEKNRALSNVLSDITAVEKAKFAAQNQVGQYAPDFTGKAKPLTGKQEALVNGGFDPANYLTGSVRISPNISTSGREVLTKVQAMSPDAKEKYLREGDHEYQYELAKFENDSANNELSAVDRYEQLIELGKLKIESKYSPEARELRALSKKELQAFTAANPVPQKILDEVYAMDNELVAKGFYARSKFGVGGSGGGGGGGKKAKTLSVPLPKFGSFSLVSPPTSPTPDISDVMSDYRNALGKIKVLQASLPPESSSNIQITV